MELLDHSLVSGFTLYIDLVVMDLLAPEPPHIIVGQPDLLLDLLPIPLRLLPLLLWSTPLPLVELKRMLKLLMGHKLLLGMLER